MARISSPVLEESCDLDLVIQWKANQSPAAFEVLSQKFSSTIDSYLRTMLRGNGISKRCIEITLPVLASLFSWIRATPSVEMSLIMRKLCELLQIQLREYERLDSHIYSLSAAVRLQIDDLYRSVSAVFSFTPDALDAVSHYPKNPKLPVAVTTFLESSSSDAPLIQRRVEALFKRAHVDDMPFTSDEFSFRQLFPIFDWSKTGREHNMKELARIGFPQVQGRLFNVAVFRLADGSFSSGFDVLSAKNEKADDLDLHKRTCLDRDLRPEDILDAARHPENLKAMQEHFMLRVEDGRWVAHMPSEAFRRRWFSINGGTKKSGYELLRMCDLVPKDGGYAVDQDAIERFCILVFGTSTSYLTSLPGGGKLAERHGEAAFLAELRSEENLAVLKSFGITVENGACHVRTSVQKFRDTAHFMIFGKRRHALALFKNLGLSATQEGLKALFQKIFPESRIIVWAHSNGSNVIRFTEEDIISEMRKPDNLLAFSKFFSVDDSGNVRVLGNISSFKGVLFDIKGRKLGIQGLLNALDYNKTLEDLVLLYGAIFGAVTGAED